MSIDYDAIGKRVRAKRCEYGYTQAELAELAEIEPSHVSHIERGATKVSLPTLIAIANVLNATLDELVYGNLKNDSAVSVQMINDIICDCTPEELRTLIKFLESAKSLLRDAK